MRLIRDVARVSDSTVLFIGCCAGVVSSLFLFALDTFGWKQVSVVMFWGHLLSGRSDTFAGRLGFFTHLIASAFFAFVYSLVFRSSRRSGAGIGIHVAFYHWLLSGVAMTFAWPGPFVLWEGIEAAVAFLGLHLVFGAVVGMMFDRAAIGFDHPRPIGPVSHSPADSPASDQRELSRSHRVRGTIRV